MRILYDGLIYAINPIGGISRYFANLISRLPESFIATLTTYHSPEITYPVNQNLKLFQYKHFRPGRISTKLDKYFFRIVSELNYFDLVHPTYYSLLTLQEINRCKYPVVLTVHDMIHELFSELIDPDGQHTEMKRKAILAAQAIICVSENTKKDLLERYSLPDHQVTVTYLASEINADLAYGSQLIPSKPYFLYVGSRDVYKNFDGLLLAFAKAVSVRTELGLCVVGRPFNEIEKKLIAELNLSDNIEYYGHISDSHLAKLYRCSIGFVYPSLYEGFGIPPLEAMSCKTVVIASNCSSIPEVVGDAGLLFNPKATNDLADILLFILDNPGERERLIARGVARAKQFSWEATVSKTIEVYRAVTQQ